ncbi:MAG: FecR family protein [Pseudomonadota bacterium]
MFPAVVEPMQMQPSGMDEAPDEVMAWVEHAAGEARLQERLEELASSLAHGEAPSGQQPTSQRMARLPSANEIPDEVQAWIEHAAADELLQERLEELACSLADSEAPYRRRQGARPTGQRRAFLLAAAAILLGVLAWRENHPRPVLLVEPGAPAQVAEVAPAEAPPSVVVMDEPTPALPEPSPAPQRPRRLARSFDGAGDGRLLAVVSGVDVLLDGHLELSGTASSPHLTLQGSATFDVTPGSVKDLIVESTGANVRVLGTRFTVAEGATGTSVSVERGKVAVQCIVGDPLQLIAGEQHACPKPNASGMLVYIRQLKNAGASQEQVLAAAERGLAYRVSQPALRSSLQLERIEALSALGREAEAREEVQACLESCEAVYLEKAQELARRLGLQP